MSIDNPMALPFPSAYWNERDDPATECVSCGADLCDRAPERGDGQCCKCFGDVDCKECFPNESEADDE